MGRARRQTRLAVKPTPRTEYYIRDDLAESYWSDRKNDRAAEVWRKMLRLRKDRCTRSQARNGAGQFRFRFSETPAASTTFLQAWRLQIESDHKAARKELIIALGYVDNNPDYVIALGRVLDDDAVAKQTFDDALNTMIETSSKHYRRRSKTPCDAINNACNRKNRSANTSQLAWLLA
ncbi:MAG: hypothetical protein U0892_03125 [Pirellulales bacterium]